MVRRRAQARRPRRNMARRNNRTKFFTGGKIRSKVNPSPVVTSPWYNLTIQRQIPLADDSSLTITLPNIRTWIAAQLGITFQTLNDPVVRLQAIQVFDLASRPITLQILDSNQSTTSNDKYTTVRDFPGKNSWASVKAQYPLWMRTDGIVASTTSSIVVAIATSGVSFEGSLPTNKYVMVNLTLLWKVPGSVLPLAIREQSFDTLPDKIDSMHM